MFINANHKKTFLNTSRFLYLGLYGFSYDVDKHFELCLKNDEGKSVVRSFNIVLLFSFWLGLRSLIDMLRN